MKKLLLRPRSDADVILTKPLARLVLFSSSCGSGDNSPNNPNKTPKLESFFWISSIDDVAVEEKSDAPLAPTLRQFRQSVASLAGLISDLDHADWPALSSACDHLRQETKGTPLEKSVELLQDPSRRRHVHALAQTIDTLLRPN